VFRRSEAAKVLADVVGMDAYRRGLTAHLSGVEASGSRLTIRLKRPVTDLGARLAAPYFCAVPKDTPAIPEGLQAPIPSAGPYYIAGVSGGAFDVLRRNPYYPQRNRASFEAFVYEFNVDEQRAIEMIKHGQADYAAFYGDDSRAALARLRAAAGGDTAVRFRLSPRPGVRGAGGRRTVAEFFGRRLGCRSYSPLYAGVELKRLCPAGGGG
jgi:ABC-type oligopeptide transport system substrate-binding subunit